MKKVTTLVLVVLLFAGVANAQLRFGFKGGLNVSSLSSTSSVIDQVKAASGYQAGVLMQLKLGGFAIQPELLYSVRSSDMQISADEPKLRDYIGSVASLDYKTQNIVIPVNIQLGSEIGPLRVFALAGPYVSFQLGGALNGDVKLYNTVDENLKFNKMDWGLGFGLGAELFGLQLSAKYDFGMIPAGKEFILNSSQNTPNLNPFNDVKNRNINISLAYLF